MATEKSPHFQQRGSGVGGSGGSVTQAQRPHCDCERWCVRQCCLTGSSNDLHRLSRKPRISQQYGETPTGRGGTGGQRPDIIQVYAFMFLLSLPCVNKELLPPSHSVYHIFIITTFYCCCCTTTTTFTTARSDAAAPATCWEQKRWGVKGRREGGSLGHSLPRQTWKPGSSGHL